MARRYGRGRRVNKDEKMKPVGTMVIASGAVDSCSTELSSDEAHHGRSVVGVEAARTKQRLELSE
jgi:hypothetical protein